MTDQATAAEISKTALVPMGRRLSGHLKTDSARPKRAKLPNGAALARVQAAGIDNILSRIVNGETLNDIAQSIRLPLSTLQGILTADESFGRYVRARVLSADAWLERGMRYLIDAAGSPAEVNRARALAQECARQAAIRNPRYSERNLVELSGPDGGPIQSQVQIAVYLPQNHRVTLDKEPV